MSRRQNTSHGDELHVTIIHPFHPKRGNTYKVVRQSHASGKTTLRCSDDNGSQFLIAANLTDYASGVAVPVESGNALDLDFRNLMELREIVDRLMNVQ